MAPISRAGYYKKKLSVKRKFWYDTTGKTIKQASKQRNNTLNVDETQNFMLSGSLIEDTRLRQGARGQGTTTKTKTQLLGMQHKLVRIFQVQDGRRFDFLWALSLIICSL